LQSAYDVHHRLIGHENGVGGVKSRGKVLLIQGPTASPDLQGGRKGLVKHKIVACRCLRQTTSVPELARSLIVDI
jgi:hypothetical protein